MKNLALILLASAGLHANAAALKFLPDYNPANETHGPAFLSTTEHPISGVALMDRDSTTTGVCYMGQPADAESLIMTMLNMATTNDGIQISDLMLSTVQADKTAPTNISLQFQVDGRHENTVITYSSIPACSK
jgi:hypothetical protein